MSVGIEVSGVNPKPFLSCMIILLFIGSTALAGCLGEPTRGDEQPDDPEGSVGGEGIEGSGEEVPDGPDEDDTWGKEEEPFTGGNATTTRVLEITEDSVDASAAWREFDGNPLKLFDIDRDGRKEIIAQNDNHWVYVFDSRDGDLLAELRSSMPSYWGARTFNGPEAAVLQPGGAVHLVTANSAAVVAAYRFDAINSTADAFVFEEAWEVRLDSCFEEPGMDAKLVLADLTLDGNLEILAATEESGTYALRHDGSILWENCMNGGNAEPVVGDVIDDGWPDVVHVSDDGVVALLNGRTGEWIWGFEILDHYDLGSASIPASAALGQLRGGPGLDIVVAARDSHDPGDWDNNSALLLALDRYGEVLWDAQDPEGNPLTYGRPIIVDAEGDGEAEVYWGDWNTVGHKPPSVNSEDAWKRTGPANHYRYSANGERVWKQTMETWWSNKDIAIADVTGDGRQEVLVNGPDVNGKDGIWYLNAANGSKEAWVSLDPWKAQRGPVVADLWGTDTTQWVIQVASNSAGTGPAILVYDTQVPYDAAWPHVPYPERDQAFDVVFSDVRGSLNWAAVKARQSGERIETVEVRTDSIDWQAMQDEGWAWTSTAEMPEGAIVQFRATSISGSAILSDCYEWTEAEKVPCPSGMAS